VIRKLALLAALVALFGVLVAACGGSEEAAPPPPAEEPAPPAEEPAPPAEEPAPPAEEPAPPAEEPAPPAEEPAPPAEEPAPPAEEPPAAEGPLVVNAPIGPATLDLWANACGFHDQWAGNMYAQITEHPAIPGPTEDAFGRPLEGLTVTVMDTTKLSPDLVTWEVDPTGTVYTWHINENATFEDGTPIDSAAVKASFDRAMALQSCGSYFWIAGQYDNIPKVETPDDKTVVLTFSRPEGALLAGWATTPSSVLQPSVLAEHPDKEGAVVNEYWASHIIGGGGPYILDEYVPNQSMRMHANPDYYGDPPLAQDILVNFINSESTLLLQAKEGQADVTFDLSPEAVESLKDNPDVNVIEVPAFQHWNVNLNWDVPPIDNVKVREALTYAVPYQDILDQVAKGYGNLYYGPIAQNLPFFNPEVSAPREFDLAKAQALLKESGVKTPLNLELVVQQGSGIPERVGTILQSVWKQIGINLKVTKLGPTEYNETVESGKAQMSIRLDGPGAPDPGWLLGFDMVCDVQFNLSNICIPEADKLLLKARTSTDPNEQQQLYDQITELWRAQSPKIILFGVNQLIVLNKRVKNYHWNILSGFQLEKIGR
jgi:peptide/nickel transport system substrate-binding protein